MSATGMASTRQKGVPKLMRSALENPHLTQPLRPQGAERGGPGEITYQPRIRSNVLKSRRRH